MKHDRFEDRLKQVPVRRLPGEWKSDILNRAAEEARLRGVSGERVCGVERVGRKGFQVRTALAGMWRAYERLFLGWRGWAALGGAWVLIALIQGVGGSWGEKSEMKWVSVVPLSREARLILAEQKRVQWGAEMVLDADRGKGQRRKGGAGLPGRSRQGEWRPGMKEGVSV